MRQETIVVIARAEVSPAVLAKLQLACLDLPEAYEESAWAGTRWMIGKKNFAHVLMIADGWPPAYAQAAGTPGPACVLTFRVPRRSADAPRFQRHPFFRPVWFPNIVGMFVDDATDWDDVNDLLIGSYRVLAPKNLAERVEGR